MDQPQTAQQTTAAFGFKNQLLALVKDAREELLRRASREDEKWNHKRQELREGAPHYAASVLQKLVADWSKPGLEEALASVSVLEVVVDTHVIDLLANPLYREALDSFREELLNLRRIEMKKLLVSEGFEVVSESTDKKSLTSTIEFIW